VNYVASLVEVRYKQCCFKMQKFLFREALREIVSCYEIVKQSDTIK